MTEDEAKKKWCPNVRQVQETADYLSFNNRGEVSSAGDHFPRTMCLGSSCMAWRWSRARETKAFLEKVQEQMKDQGPNANFGKACNVVYAKHGTEFEQTEGYCGAFGKPE